MRFSTRATAFHHDIQRESQHRKRISLVPSGTFFIFPERRSAAGHPRRLQNDARNRSSLPGHLILSLFTTNSSDLRGWNFGDY
jgi:hypothetical protein